MLRLTPISAPQWISLGEGVRVHVLPLSAVILARASEAAYARDDLPPPPLPGEAPGPASHAYIAALTDAVAAIAITDWDGVGDSEGNPVPVSSEYVSALMAVSRFQNAFFASYVAHAFAVAEEKKGSAPLLNGTSAGALPTATDAVIPAENVRAV